MRKLFTHELVMSQDTHEYECRGRGDTHSEPRPGARKIYYGNFLPLIFEHCQCLMTGGS